MRVFSLLFGSVLSFLFIIQMFRGKKYASLTEALTGDSFPLKDLYIVGFAWNDTKLLALRGKMRIKMVGEAKLVFDARYAEFYATAIWAQVITFLHALTAIGLVLGGLLNTALFSLIGVAAGVLFAYSSLNNMHDDLEKRKNACLEELPEIVSTMALLINSGMVLKQAWETIAFGKEGMVYDLMRTTCADMENGMSEIDAIYKFGVMSNTPEVKKFASGLIQGIEKGSSDLAEHLVAQSAEMWALKKQIMLQKGESAGAKLLGPTAMIFVGIILVVAAGVVGMMF